jgi:hypothetical protein
VKKIIGSIIQSENEELRSYRNHNVLKRQMGIVLPYDDDDSCDNEQSINVLI